MPLVPDDWNVVIVGHWNRAILTPSGIVRRLFELPEGTPVQVLVPLDTIAPHQVRHENVTVIPSSDRLVVQPVNSTIENLGLALGIARRALEDLPRTPVTAAVFNLRYRSEQPVETLVQLMRSDWDDRLSDQDYQIEARMVSRSVRWRNGKIRVFVSQEPEVGYVVLLNFELLASDSAELLAWLNVTAADIRTQADRILYQTIGLADEDVADA